MGRGRSGIQFSRGGGATSSIERTRVLGAGNVAQNANPNAGFLIDGVRFYASRGDARDNARPDETEIAMVASGSGFAFYYVPMRPDDYRAWVRGERRLLDILRQRQNQR